jgi:hypothetical protein
VLSKTLHSLGKSGLILVGGAFGLIRSLRLFENLAQNTRSVTENAALLKTLQAQVDTVHLALARLGTQTGELQSRLGQMATAMVTKDELDQTLEQVFGRFESSVEARFDHQSRSVDALRVMVSQTDELLERVLDGLEGMRTEDEAEAELDLTPAGG